MNTLQAKAYVIQLAKIIAADGVIDTKELRRIYEVMAAFELGSDTRIEILDLLYFHQQKLMKMDIDPYLLDEEEIKIALSKDVLFIESQNENKSNNVIAKEILYALNITQEQLKFLKNWVSWENAALRRLGAGEIDLADEGDLNELAARAASIGIPLSALYISGTIGFSAVGLTTGLATLGSMSGIALLGLNPMTAGIAALIIAGISVKKICDYALKTGKKKQIEAALHQAKILQLRYREYLLKDMTEFEKSSISDMLTRKGSKRQKAIESFRYLLSESLKQEEKS